MHPSRFRRCLLSLLALLLLVNGVLVAAQSAHQAIEAHSVAVATAHDDGCHDHYAPASIDSGADEHGHCFHVHLPVHALVAYSGLFDIDTKAAGVVMTTPPLPVSLLTAPPVPPPNA